MGQDSTQKENDLKQSFKYINQFMLLMWRLGLGQMINIWPEGVGRIMVITTTGRKTGLERRTPVNYAEVDGEIYCVSGFGQESDWYRNLRADPQVQVWLPSGWWSGKAEEINDKKQRLPLIRQVVIDSAFAGRLAGLNPQSMSDEELNQATASYRLIHIKRTQPRTGQGGPGELSWVWPLATMIMLPMLIRANRRARKVQRLLRKQKAPRFLRRFL